MSNRLTITLTIDLPDGATVSAGAEPVVSVPAPAVLPTATPALASLEADDSDWTCPRHGGYRVVPAGTSKTTGKPYAAFRVCREQGCNEKEPRRRVA